MVNPLIALSILGDPMPEASDAEGMGLLAPFASMIPGGDEPVYATWTGLVHLTAADNGVVEDGTGGDSSVGVTVERMSSGGGIGARHPFAGGAPGPNASVGLMNAAAAPSTGWNPNSANIRFLIRFIGGDQVLFYSRGNIVHQVSDVTVDDFFEVAEDSGAIVCRVNGSVVYTHAIAPYATMMGRVSIATSGDAVPRIQLTGDGWE